MAETTQLVSTLKQLLKTSDKTYQDVADTLFLSEASVKQMFASNRITLERLDSVCNDLLGIEISDLVQKMHDQIQHVAELTVEQEQQLVANQRLFIVAVSVMNNWTPAEIVEQFEIEMDECRRHLKTLQELNLIAVRSDDNIRLQVDRNFRWRPDGPIQQFFEQHMQGDFLDSRFAAGGEKRMFLTGMLSARSSAELMRRIDRLAADFLELNRDDSKMELRHRVGSSILIAFRPWQMAAFAELRRAPGQPASEE